MLKNKFFISFEQLEEFQWKFRNGMTYDSIKSHKKPGLNPLSMKLLLCACEAIHLLNKGMTSPYVQV